MTNKTDYLEALYADVQEELATAEEELFQAQEAIRYLLTKYSVHDIDRVRNELRERFFLHERVYALADLVDLANWNADKGS